MKKQLIAVGLAGLLTIPAVSFGAEMAGPSLYGSFRTGLTFGSGDATVGDFTSRWGFKGSHEVAEGLTASYKYESKITTTNAKSSGSLVHGHDGVDAVPAMAAVPAGDVIAAISALYSQEFYVGGTVALLDDDGDPVVQDDVADDVVIARTHVPYMPGTHTLVLDDDGNVMTDEFAGATFASQIHAEDDANTADVDETGTTQFYFRVNNRLSGYGVPEIPGDLEIPATVAIPAIEETKDGGPGGRLSYVSLSGGFGTIALGQIWSASANHYGFAVDPSYVNGVFGGASYRPGNTVSYSSSAGDVTFQIDKVTGDDARVELGTSANLGPVGVGLGYWSNSNDDAGFTGVAVSSGAAGVNLTIGLGSSTGADGAKSKWNILHVGGSVGDSGLSYAVQVANSDKDAGVGDQNLLVVTNSLGSGASLIFEHVSHGDAKKMDSSLLGLKVDF